MKASHVIYGIHAAQAALDYTPAKIKGVWLDEKRRDGRLQTLRNRLLALGIAVQLVDRKQLDQLTQGKNHQGVAVELQLPHERGEKELKEAIENAARPLLFLVLDRVQDPHNFGACLRTADATGVHGVIITKDQSVGISPTVYKVASGAAETVPVYRITNLARILRWLKEQGVWLVGADGTSKMTVYEVSLREPVAIVVGAEGRGLRRLTKDLCDFCVALPMLGTVESLNLSVATGVLLYEAVRQRAYQFK